MRKKTSGLKTQGIRYEERRQTNKKITALVFGIYYFVGKYSRENTNYFKQRP